MTSKEHQQRINAELTKLRSLVYQHLGKIVPGFTLDRVNLRGQVNYAGELVLVVSVRESPVTAAVSYSHTVDARYFKAEEWFWLLVKELKKHLAGELPEHAR